MAEAKVDSTQKGILGWVERTGNRLPDPVFIFFYLIGILMVISVLWHYLALRLNIRFKKMPTERRLL